MREPSPLRRAIAPHRKQNGAPAIVDPTTSVFNATGITAGRLTGSLPAAKARHAGTSGISSAERGFVHNLDIDVEALFNDTQATIEKDGSFRPRAG